MSAQNTHFIKQNNDQIASLNFFHSRQFFMISANNTYYPSVTLKPSSTITTNLKTRYVSQFLGWAVGSIFLLPTVTANAAVIVDSVAPSDPYIHNSSVTTDNASVHNTNYGAISTNLFLECASVKNGPARLACFDKVIETGNSTVSAPKKPIDLTKTFESTLDGNLKAVLASQEPIETQVPDSQVLAKVGVNMADIQERTTLSLAYDLDANSDRGLWSPRPYESIYMLPVFVTANRNKSPETPSRDEFIYTGNEYRPVELKAQISVKTKALQDLFSTNEDLWIGYTQQMHWQVYNEDNSRPFRATDYMPEIFLTQPVKADLPFKGHVRMLGAGAIHHSNGQDEKLSRSWNRLYVMGGAEWKNLTIIPKAWVHVKNDDGRGSDNPDITDYYGHGELKAMYTFSPGHSLGATGRYNWSHDKGGLQLDYTHPIANDVQGYIQLFHGYGESIIDYNHKSTSVGVGIMLSDWKSLQ